jgi:hypothetical protein
MQTAWEASATHGSVSHDQVSALLVVIALPAGSPPNEAARLAGVENFAQTARTRYLIPADEALEGILPTGADQSTFAENAMKHVCAILSDELEGWGHHRDDLLSIFDPWALPDDQTEEYFLPTFDQEQSSTRGTGHRALLPAHFRYSEAHLRGSQFLPPRGSTHNRSGPCRPRSTSS